MEVPTEALQQATDRARVKAASTMKKSQGKPNSDFIRLDMRPAGYDLKAYCARRAGEVSASAGQICTVTGYIQRVLIEDMVNSSASKSKDEKLMEQIRALKPENRKLIEKLIDALQEK